ncbi:DUF6968 family protein [Corynebacterium pygosceleis]|uniref:DUF6968 domain-containing protein n=1 Tax=Corynebacterium pygosceleis TaxID=2800406 RepID=A0A9Q4C6F2_9CORY|nr:hypothetical protein [Corynebacterium pygosceleis]MCK7636569.1 hypothetical protein [Corynebacterium pygosceleis]MCK7675143.1 hypothetical protein [Corynebacterium pygosceleis]MCL0120640.1 hypothetical protein [Corynebacterium pygosceleis]MCX7444195.1 hypothetical protein [Corynebacterium pygosceleis]MCX7467322.1 hypothetical protein [Corynebacterium pygosceleis]
MDNTIQTLVSRTLHREDGSSVTVEIAAPVKRGEDFWETRWRILGLREGDVESASGGVDSMQSLLAALAMSGDRVAGDSDLTFLEGPGTGLLHSGKREDGFYTAVLRMPT